MKVKFTWLKIDKDSSTGQPTEWSRQYIEMDVNIKGLTETQGGHFMDLIRTRLKRNRVYFQEGLSRYQRFEGETFTGHLVFERDLWKVGEQREMILIVLKYAKKDYIANMN